MFNNVAVGKESSTTAAVRWEMRTFNAQLTVASTCTDVYKAAP